MTCFRCDGTSEIGSGICTEATGRLCQDCADDVDWKEMDKPAEWLPDEWIERHWPEHYDD